MFLLLHTDPTWAAAVGPILTMIDMAWKAATSTSKGAFEQIRRMWSTLRKEGHEAWSSIRGPAAATRTSLQRIWVEGKRFFMLGIC